MTDIENVLTDRVARDNLDALLRLERTPQGIVEEPKPLATAPEKPFESKATEEKDISLLSDLSSIPKQIVLDSADAVVETGRAINDFAEWSARHMGIDTTAGKEILESLPSIPEFGGEDTGPISNFFGTMSKFMVGMANTSKLLNLAKLDKIENVAGLAGKALTSAKVTARGAIAGGGAGATVFGPDEENIAAVVRDLAQKHEVGLNLFNALPPSVQDLLSALPDMEGDSPMMKRTKAFFAEALGGVPFEAVMTAARVWKASRDANKLLKRKAQFDESSGELRKEIGDSPLVEAKKGVEQLASDSASDLKAHQKTHGTKAQIKEPLPDLKRQLDELEADPTKTADDTAEVQGLIGEVEETLKKRSELEKGARDARKAVKELEAAIAKSKTGLHDGAERFVHRIIANGKPFNISQFGVSLKSVGGTKGMIAEIGRVVNRLKHEASTGTSFGSQRAKKEVIEVLGKTKAALKDDADGFISQSLAQGARTKEEQVAIEILRSISGNHVYGLMEAVKRGDHNAIAQLPVALARAADIEMLAKDSVGWFGRSFNTKEMERNLALSDFGGGRNYNAQAAEMLAEMRKTIPDADGVDIAARLNTLQSPEQFRALVSEAGKPGMFDAFLESYYNAILSGIDSMGAAGIGSHAFLVYQFPVRALAAAYGHGVRALKGPPKFGEAQDQASFSALMAGMQGYGKAFANSVYPMIRNLARIGILKDPELHFSRQKFEKFHQKALTGEVMRPLIESLDKAVRYGTQDAISLAGPMEFAFNALGNIMRSFQNVYGTFDEFNKQVASNFEKHYQAQLHVDRAGLGPIESKEMMEELLRKTPKEITEMSEQFADMVAFTEKLEKSEGFRVWVDNYPGLRVIFPFIRSQASMFDSFLANSPVAPLFSPKFKSMYEAGGAQRQIAIAQTALGWMVLQQVWSGWSAGRITGDSGRGLPLDELRRVGHQSNSILASGDSWVVRTMNNLPSDKSIAGKVIHVDDADTATVQDANGTLHEIRFKNVNADEKNQRLGPAATAKLKNMILGKNVTVEWKTKGHFGRIIGNVIHDGKSINKAIIDEAEGARFKPDAGKYISYSALEPFATNISLIVNTLEAVQRIDDPENTRHLLQILAEDVGSNLLNRQYFNGVFQIIDAMNTGGDDIVENLADALIPKIAKDISNTFAGRKRDLKTFDPNLAPTHLWFKQRYAQIAALDPRYREDIPQFDGYGIEAGVRPPVTIGSFWNVPRVRSADARNDSSVFQEFLMNGFHRGQFEPKISFGGGTVDLNAEQFVEYQRNMQKATATSIDGQEQEFMIAMRDLVLSKAYQDADNKIGPDGQRYAMLKGVYDFYKQRAGLLVLDKHEDLIVKLEEDIQNQKDALENDKLPMNLPNDIKVLLESQLPNSDTR